MGRYKLAHEFPNDIRFRVKNDFTNDLKKLGNTKKMSKFHRIIA